MRVKALALCFRHRFASGVGSIQVIPLAGAILRHKSQHQDFLPKLFARGPKRSTEGVTCDRGTGAEEIICEPVSVWGVCQKATRIKSQINRKARPASGIPRTTIAVQFNLTSIHPVPTDRLRSTSHPKEVTLNSDTLKMASGAICRLRIEAMRDPRPALLITIVLERTGTKGVTEAMLVFASPRFLASCCFIG